MNEVDMETQLERVALFEILDKMNRIEADTILLVVDEKVWSYYKDRFDIDKISKFKKVNLWVAPRGEETKRIAEYEKCMESFLEKGVHRNAHLVAIGGGGLSDFAGFVASTIVRGIKWSVVPTTLLAMVDASIGGKVGLNSRYGKNLIGNFHIPENIWLCSDFLKTVSEDEIQSGLGEVIKYSFLSKSIFEMVKKRQPLEDIIQTCAQYKLDITRQDLRDGNIRKALNLGHTLGHALEKAFSLKHGISVFWGMVLVFHLFNNEKCLENLRIIKDSLNWKNDVPPWSVGSVPVKKIISYIEKDKKIKSNNKIDLIQISEIGVPIIKEYNLVELIEKIEEVLNAPSRLTL